MASQRTKFTVGLFMTVGITIALLAFIWLGMSRYLEKGRYYATYFDESVQGLDSDSPVKYRGKSVGRVAHIEVAPDSKLMQVIMKIETDFKPGPDIVAELKNVGITGSMFIELDKKKEEDPDSPALKFPTEYEVIASKTSTIEYIIDQIRALDIADISESFKLTLKNLDQAIIDANIKGLSAKLETSLEDIGSIVEKEKWDRILSSLENTMNSLESVMVKADVSVGHIETTLASLESITTKKEKSIEEAIEEFKIAVEKVNIFVGYQLFMINLRCA